MVPNSSEISARLQRKILGLKTDLLCEAVDADGRKAITNYFRELSAHPELLDVKYHRSNAHIEADCFVNTRPRWNYHISLPSLEISIFDAGKFHYSFFIILS